MTKVLGIGNALVDILTMVEDESLMQALKLPKGSMQLVDGHRCNDIALATNGMRQSKASGGSAANTIHGLARLGVETAFIGHVGDDDTGHFFSSDMQQAGIKPLLFRSATPTGIANGLISPDGERTFATYLGAAIELSAAHLDEALFVGYDYLYVEGYLVQNEALLIKAMELAKAAGLKVVLDLASYNVVESNLPLLQRVMKDYVDIVFANEEEAKAFSGQEPQLALGMLAALCEVAIVKVGAKGSYVQRADEVVKVEAIAAKAIDTTGAGDLFAAGFLFGLINGEGLRKAALTGAVLAGNVVEVVGPKMDDARWAAISKAIGQL